MSAPLLGRNLVRLIYLDEAGADLEASHLCVAGVLVHGDFEWPEVDKRILALIEKYIPERDRLGFVFRATDIFHGSKYYKKNRAEWPFDRRIELLSDLAGIIEGLHLPVVFGQYDKEKLNAAANLHNPKARDRLVHNLSVLDCLIRADRWLEKFAPTELATVIHEDGTPAKSLIKLSVRWGRDEKELQTRGFTEESRPEGLPLKRIIDTVHFAEKADARPLQLADMCVCTRSRIER